MGRAVLPHRRTQTVGVDVVGHLLRNLIVHERLDIYVVGIQITVVLRGKGILHVINGPMDSFTSTGKPLEVLLLGILVLINDFSICDFRAVRKNGMMLGGIMRLLLMRVLVLRTIDLDVEVTRHVIDGIAILILAVVPEVKSLAATGCTLTKNKDTVVDVIHEHLTILHLWSKHIPTACHLHGQHVADKALVLPRRQKAPVVVLTHAEQADLVFFAVDVVRFEQLDGHRLLGLRAIFTERRGSAPLDGYRAVVLDGLVGIGMRDADVVGTLVWSE